jgi:hypothetical protein
MRIRSAVLMLAVPALLCEALVSAHPATLLRGPRAEARGQGAAPVRRAPRLPAGVKAHRDNKTVAEQWLWHMGMLRGVYEIDGVATLEVEKSTGTVRVAGQPCTLVNYRASMNYQVAGMRVQYTCTRADGQQYKAIEVVSGQFAWDEDIPGAELVPGKGKATPKPDLLNERLIRLWSSPQGAPKAAEAAGVTAKVTTEGGKTVVSYPVPGVMGAVARATLTSGAPDGRCTSYCAERIEVRQGNVVTEFTYSNYEDYNDSENRIDAFFPGRMIEKRDGATVLDLTVERTETGNVYVVMPVPESVRRSGGR